MIAISCVLEVLKGFGAFGATCMVIALAMFLFSVKLAFRMRRLKRRLGVGVVSFDHFEMNTLRGRRKAFRAISLSFLVSGLVLLVLFLKLSPLVMILGREGEVNLIDLLLLELPFILVNFCAFKVALGLYVWGMIKICSVAIDALKKV